MSTAKPRLSVTMKPELYAIVAEIASIRGVSMSSVVSEYLEAAEPVLERTATILAAVDAQVKAAESGIQSDMLQYRKNLEEAEKTLAPMLASALGAMDSIEPPPSNTGVTPPRSADDSGGSTGSKAPSDGAPSGDHGYDV